ncbi:MAG: hypothetical protein QFB86_03055 [Patescibacteria group bacterium]|nr:hypothetical protein [Patescibacteria group bacterium]
MNNQPLQQAGNAFQKIKPVTFLILAGISTIVAIFALRANNEHMIELRQKVYTADEKGTDVQKPLKDLQLYVISHMNTDLGAGPTPVYPPIQLKYTYDRLVRAQGDATAKANTELYTAAQAYCEQQNSHDVSGRNRIPCIEQYVQQHNPQKIKQIPDALYKFSFITPKWSPDLAGWSIVIAVVSFIAFVSSFAVQKLTRRNA